jgi:hypothetical protein
MRITGEYTWHRLMFAQAANGQGVGVSASGIRTLAFILLIGLILYVSGAGGL